MSNPFRLLSLVLVMSAILVLDTGCRRKLDLRFRGESPTSGGNIPVDGVEFGTLPPGAELGTGVGGVGGAGTGWESTDTSMNTGDAASMSAKRWDVVVYFAFDSAAIGPSEMPKVEALAEHLKTHAQYGVVVEGHCDDRGSDEYNRALGQQRAIVVRDLLCSMGVEPGRIETVSYGEERPAVPNATSEAEWQKNRRAEFLFKQLQ